MKKSKVDDRVVLQSLVLGSVSNGTTQGIRSRIDNGLTPEEVKLILENHVPFEQFLCSNVTEAVRTAIDETVRRYGKNRVYPFYRAFEEEKIEIPATDGSKTFADAFPHKVSASGFKKARRRSKPTPKTAVEIYDLSSGGPSFQDFYGFWGWRDLCLTESQIAMFCRNRRRFLGNDRDSFTSFFYQEKGGNIGVATVTFSDSSEPVEDRGWFIGPSPFEESCGSGERIVVPVLKS